MLCDSKGDIFAIIVLVTLYLI